MFLASNCTYAVYFTNTAHVQLLAKNMAATHVHVICTRIAYAIKQTPYAFVAKIILCMYLLYATNMADVQVKNTVCKLNSFKLKLSERCCINSTALNASN